MSKLTKPSGEIFWRIDCQADWSAGGVGGGAGGGGGGGSRFVML